MAGVSYWESVPRKDGLGATSGTNENSYPPIEPVIPRVYHKEFKGDMGNIYGVAKGVIIPVDPVGEDGQVKPDSEGKYGGHNPSYYQSGAKVLADGSLSGTFHWVECKEYETFGGKENGEGNFFAFDIDNPGEGYTIKDVVVNTGLVRTGSYDAADPTWVVRIFPGYEIDFYKVKDDVETPWFKVKVGPTANLEPAPFPAFPATDEVDKDNKSKMLDKLPSDLQSLVTIDNDGVVSGIFHYVKEFTAFNPSEAVEQEGHYLVFKVRDPRNKSGKFAAKSYRNGEIKECTYSADDPYVIVRLDPGHKGFEFYKVDEEAEDETKKYQPWFTIKIGDKCQMLPDPDPKTEDDEED